MNRISELGDDPQFVARDVFVNVERPDGQGTFRVAAEPVRVAGDKRRAPQPAPAPGQHTNAILHDAGYDTARIDALRATGIIS